jgi:hypothetical protein
MPDLRNLQKLRVEEGEAGNPPVAPLCLQRLSLFRNAFGTRNRRSVTRRTGVRTGGQMKPESRISNV